jgi:hypothetical protein
VSLHIDGFTTARQISIKAEVDMEMVLSCLRVLRHHGVIALVDMFFFTNHYETTDQAASLLQQDSKMWEAAAVFVSHRHQLNEQQSPSNFSISSPGHVYPNHGKPISSSSSSVDQRLRGKMPGLVLHGNGDTADGHSRQAGGTGASVGSHAFPLDDSRQQEGLSEIKIAVKELYLLCTRDESIGDIWIKILTGQQPRTSVSIDWKRVFQTIDHRRFTTFGIVHGLLRRVHRFPMLLDINFTNAERPAFVQAHDVDGGDDGRESHARSTSRHRLGSEDEEEIRSRLAWMLDGRHCDDELVCIFDKPINDLLDMMNNRLVVSTFAPYAL